MTNATIFNTFHTTTLLLLSFITITFVYQYTFIVNSLPGSQLLDVGWNVVQSKIERAHFFVQLLHPRSGWGSTKLGIDCEIKCQRFRPFAQVLRANWIIAGYRGILWKYLSQCYESQTSRIPSLLFLAQSRISGCRSNMNLRGWYDTRTVVWSSVSPETR